MKLSSQQIQQAESLIEAIEYIYLFDREKLLPESQLPERIDEVFRDYRRSRTYWHTEEELAYGAKVAWRNSSRCIGRIFWESLIVQDLRHLTTAAEIFAAMKVFHLHVKDICLKPNFFPMPAPWTQAKGDEQNSQSIASDDRQQRCPFHSSKKHV
jgi:nitric oxide synthase oxygenase domain/subunit